MLLERIEGLVEKSAAIAGPSLVILLKWIPVLDAKGEPADCHTKGLKRTRVLRTLLVGPQIYRWVISDLDSKIVAIYIGETGKVQKRLSLYRNGHKKVGDTVNHLKEQFERAVQQGHKVVFELLKIAPFTINGASINMDRLSDPAVRKLLENVAILEAKSLGFKVLNRDEDVHIKTIKKTMASLSDAERAKVVDLLGLGSTNHS